MNPGTHTRNEIMSQAAVWRATLDDILERRDTLRSKLQAAYAPFIVTGCGSTYYLALATAAVLRSVGQAAWALPASELALLPLEHLPDPFTLLAISRSGTTTETLWAVDRYRRERADAHVVSITCVPDTPLVAGSDVVLIAPEAQEQSVAQTRSFTSMALLGHIMAGLLAADDQRLRAVQSLPELLSRLVERENESFAQLGNDLSIERIFFLGNGPLYGIACEAMLKTKEMTCSWSEAYHTLEFRHGPMSVVNQSSLVVGLISDSAAEAEVKVLRQMKELGARTLALTEQHEGMDWQGIDRVVTLESGLDEWTRGPLYLPLIQWMAFHRALAKGLDPDHPVNLTAVVTL